MKIKRTYSKVKKRDLFLKGDIVRYDDKGSHCGYYVKEKRMIVLEDESPERFSGVYISTDDTSFMGESVIIYTDGGFDEKGVVEYNFNLCDDEVEVVNSKTGETSIINTADISGELIKEYIIELDEEYYISLNRSESIDDLIQ